MACAVKRGMAELCRREGISLDLSRFDAAPLIAFIATKEMNYGTETDGRIPGKDAVRIALSSGLTSQAGG